MQLRNESLNEIQVSRDKNPDFRDTGAALEPIKLKSLLGAGH